MGDSRTQPQHLSGYKLQLSTCAAPSLPVAVLLSSETLPGQAWELVFRWKWSLEQLLPVLLSRIREAA